jgi:hypothetical protein
MLLAGEEFPVDVSLSGRSLPRQMEVVVLFGGVLSVGTARPGGEPAHFTLAAPQVQGAHKLTAITENGDMVEGQITVVADRTMRIAGIEYPSSISEGVACHVTAFVESLGGEEQATVAFSLDGSSDAKDVSLPDGGNESVTFNCSGEAAGSHAVAVSLLDSEGSYQDSWAGTVDVSARASLKDDVAKSAEDFITWLIGMVRGLLGL